MVPVGEKWAFLEVISGPYRLGDKNYYRTVRCVCGREKPLRSSEINAQTTKSCGCMMLAGKLAAATKHGHTSRKFGRTPEYSVYHAMLNRCYNPNDVAYKYYGERGITVCDRWKNSFQSFVDDMGARPKGLTLDRVNVDVGYEPSNCVWATMATQSKNKRNNVFIVADGETLCVRDACIKVGISEGKVLQYRRTREVSHQEAFDYKVAEMRNTALSAMTGGGGQ